MRGRVSWPGSSEPPTQGFIVFCFVLYLYLVLASILQFLGELKQDLTDGGPRHVGDVRDGGPLGEDAKAAPQRGDQGLP